MIGDRQIMPRQGAVTVAATTGVPVNQGTTTIQGIKIGFARPDAPTLAMFQSMGDFSTIPEGSMYWDTTTQAMYVRNNASGWSAVSTPVAGTFGLDDAYNIGRTITADDTAITLNWSHTTANLFTIARSGTGSGIGLAYTSSAASTGDAANIDMTNAVGARALNVTLAGVRTANGILLTNTGTGAVHTIAATLTGAGSGNWLNLAVSAATTGNLIHIAQSAATTAAAIKILDSASTTGQAIDIDKGDTGAPTGHGIRIDMGVAVSARAIDILESAGARSAANVLIAAGTGAHSGSVIRITDPSTRSVPVIAIAPTGALTGNIIDITNTGAVTGHFLAMDMGDTGTPTGDLINLDLGIGVACSAIKILETNGARSDHRIVITTGTGAHSASTFDLNDVSTGSVPMFDVDFTGVYTGNCLDVTYGTAAATGNAVDVNMGTNLAGDGINIDRQGVATGKCIAITHGGASTGDSILVTLTNTTACKALNIQATVAHTVAAFNMDSAGVCADNVGAKTLAHATGNIVAGGSVKRISSSAALTNGAIASTTPVSLLELTSTSTSATAVTGLTIDMAGAVRTQPALWINDQQAATGSGESIRIDLTANTTGAAKAISIVTANVAYVGKALSIDIGGATTVGATAIYIDATSAHTTKIFSMDTDGVVANNVASFHLTHTTGNLVAGGSVGRISSSAAVTNGSVSGTTPCSLLELTSTSASATALTGLAIDMGAAVRTEPALWLNDQQAATGSGPSIRVDMTTATSGAPSIFKAVVANVAYAGKVIDIDISGATTVAALGMYVNAGSAHTGKIISIDTQGVLAAGVGAIHVAHTVGNITATGNLFRLNSTAVSTGGYMQYINMTAATGCVGLHVDGGAAARTTNLVEIQDGSTDVTGAALRINMPAAAGTALKIGSGIFATAGRVEAAKGANIASGTNIVLGGDGNYFHITGTTTVNTISATGWQAGSIIVLEADGSQTWSHQGAGTGASLWLVGAANVSMTANDKMILLYDGTNWLQVAPTLVA